MEILKIVLPYFMSAITLYTMFLAGNNNKNTWKLGLFNQLLWFIWIITIQAWGLLPMTIGITIIYIRNHFKWNN